MSTCITTLSLAFSAFAFPIYADENSDFQDFLTNEFVETMESDYTTMHFTVKDYESYGITKPDDLSIGSASLDSYEEAVKDLQASLDELESYDYDSLDETSQHDYDTYHEYLENMIALNSYPMLDFAFSPNGVIDSLSTTFTEFVFYEKEDFDDYLSVLSSVPDYLEECLKLTKNQAEKGYFMTDEALDTTLDYIKGFCEKTDDNQFIVIFDENVDAFDSLSEEEKQSYKDKNKDIVLNQYIPSYEKLEEELEKLRGSRSGDGSLYSLDDGIAYYAALVRYKSGSSKSIKELFDLTDEILQEYINDYYLLIYSSQSDDYEKETVDLTTPDEILSYLENHMDNFPDGPEVTYTATYLDESVATDSVVAYYMQPAIDDITDNVIKINGDNIDSKNDLYTTLAHEGFPGHLYQITYYLNTNPNPLRTVIGSTGYTEGWGMYAELDAIDNSGLSKEAIRSLKDNTVLNYLLDSIVDLAVNGLGWTKSDVEDYLDEIGLNNSIAQDLVDFVEENPGMILPYGVGLVQYLSIQENAQEELGSKFNLKEFNTVLLTYGDRPFDVVEKDVNKWIEEAKAGNTETTTPEATSNPLPTSSENTAFPIFYIGAGAGLLAGVIALIVSKGNAA